MVRRFILCVLVTSLSGFVCAELYKPVRKVELGVNVEAGASNNYFSVDKILTNPIVLDLQDMAHNMPDDGFSLDFMVREQNYLNININEKFRLGFFAGLEGSGNLTVGHELFDILGAGFALGESKEVSVSGRGDLYFDMGLSFHTTLFQTYGITITPAYFVPLAYVGEGKGTLQFSTNANGAISAQAQASVDVYTVVDAQPFVDNEFSTEDIKEKIMDSLDKGGFDLSLAVERPIVHSLDAGIFTRIPIVPGKLGYVMTETASASFEEENLLDGLLGKDGKKYEMHYRRDDITYAELDEAKKIWRPFRLGVEAAWRPFGKWCTIRPKAALVARNPYSMGNFKIYPEYFVGAEFALFNIVGLNFSTAYENEVFVQRVGFMLNVHILQIDIKAALRGADFVNSFNYTGAGAYVGLKIGF